MPPVMRGIGARSPPEREPTTRDQTGNESEQDLSWKEVARRVKSPREPPNVKNVEKMQRGIFWHVRTKQWFERGLKPDAVKVARPVSMSRGVEHPSDSRSVMVSKQGD